MPRPDRVLTIGLTTVELWPGVARTTLPDGAVVMAAPHDTDEYRSRAYDLGYGDDTARMAVEHDLAHVLVAELLGLPESPALRAAAGGSPPAWLTDREEHAVLALQLFANSAGVDLIADAARLRPR